jgi:hypothetical protein
MVIGSAGRQSARRATLRYNLSRNVLDAKAEKRARTIKLRFAWEALCSWRCIIIISQRHGEQPHETPTEKAGSRGGLGKQPIKVHTPLLSPSSLPWTRRTDVRYGVSTMVCTLLGFHL